MKFNISSIWSYLYMVAYLGSTWLIWFEMVRGMLTLIDFPHEWLLS